MWIFEGKGGTIGQLKSVMSISCAISRMSYSRNLHQLPALIVCRSGHCGIQRYAQTWAGDNLTCWDSLKYNIATIPGHDAFRRSQPGLRHRRLLRTVAGSRAYGALDSKRYIPAPFLHSLHQHRQHGDRTLDVPATVRITSGRLSDCATS